ncbi:phage head completion protein [Planctomicrobium sp. SH661]|uniref:phage head completion protein n=1 Tax=Planctomicrobium sp. SH661 TaxID=3448124 RepID=UPI003F5ADFF1
MANNPRLTKLVTFNRIRLNPNRDEGGQVNESDPANWSSLGDRRGDCRQETSTEGYSQNQQQPSAGWRVLCRGDELTRSLTQQDRMSFTDHGREVCLNITSIKTTQDVPHYLEIQGSEI